MKPFQLIDKKTGAPRYGGQWLIKYKAPDGTWRREVAGSTKKEAEVKLRGTLTDIERGQWVDPREEKQAAREAAEKAMEGPKDWGDILEMFRKSKYTLPEQKNSRACLRYTIMMLEDGVDGSGALLSSETPIAQLNRLKMRIVYDGIASSKLATRTKNLRLTYIRIVFRWAVKHPAIPIEADPTEGLERFKDAGSRSKTVEAKPVEANEVFTLEEVQKMLAYARRRRRTANATLLETAFGTGMRKGELLGLKWSDVDFEEGLTHVRRNYDRKPKSGESRVVPLETGLSVSLKKWKAKSPFSKDHDLVFPHPDGTMKKEGYHWAYLVKSIADKAGVLRPELSRFGHLTRHTFATLYLKAGGSDVLLAKMLGHRDTRLVHQVYAHFCAHDLAADMRRCGFSLNGTKCLASSAVQSSS